MPVLPAENLAYGGKTGSDLLGAGGYVGGTAAHIPGSEVKDFRETVGGMKAEADRKKQEELFRKYQEMIAGKTASVAQMQMQAGQEQAQQQAIALAGVGRGGNLAQAARMAAQQQAGMGQEAIRQGGMLRAAEQAAATQQAAALATQMRSQGASEAQIDIATEQFLRNMQMQEASRAQQQAQWEAQMEMAEKQQRWGIFKDVFGMAVGGATGLMTGLGAVGVGGGGAPAPAPAPINLSTYQSPSGTINPWQTPPPLPGTGG